ncbi:MAG: hypothetical protein HY350_02165 [Candidatus Omnitrophica bacterium]|nr:hypothetical protein [Candidatus Omnitrophota bacterium]
MDTIEKFTNAWRITGGGLVLDIDLKTGCLSRAIIRNDKEFIWTDCPGKVTVRDDLIRKTFDTRDLEHVSFSQKDSVLTVTKSFKKAPWVLREMYRVSEGIIHWETEVVLDSGDFRSCAVSYHIPWPQSLYSVSFWTARENMPSMVYRFAEIRLEYGEVTSGILIPALCAYMEDKNVGIMFAMPFDFKTPRFSFISSHQREPELQAEFDWMALAVGRPARTSLLFRATSGNWRPALGWLYERFREYFEPRSTFIDKLWGGHLGGNFPEVSAEEARLMADLGMKWYEIHGHFPAYGNYHPEGISQWRSGHSRENTTLITVDSIRQTIKNIHSVGAAAMPYIQVTGDGDAKTLAPLFTSSRVIDRYGKTIYSDYYDTEQMNSDLSLSFGKDIIRQINGMVSRYPEIDGVFLDQACYNFLDTAHDDGLTAVDNRPGYMTGFNYFPHMEHLSSLLHPHKAIIANGPFGIGIMKYIDGFMAEGSEWLCDQFQYYALSKPMFFFLYNTGDRDIEMMFQKCLIYGAGFTSLPEAMPSKDLYDRYTPLLQRLFRRRWVFDADPLKLPTGFRGGLFRNQSGSLLASIVSVEPRLTGRVLSASAIYVRTADAKNVKKVTLQQPGDAITEIRFGKEKDSVIFDIPGNTIAALAELYF